MVIEVLYMSKNAITRHCTKSDFAIIYHFCHISCISGLFIFKICSECVYFWGTPKPSCNQLQPVRLCLVFGGFLFWKACNCNQWSGCIWLQSGPVVVFSRSVQPDLQTLVNLFLWTQINLTWSPLTAVNQLMVVRLAQSTLVNIISRHSSFNTSSIT